MDRFSVNELIVNISTHVMSETLLLLKLVSYSDLINKLRLMALPCAFKQLS